MKAEELRVGNAIWWLHEESESVKIVDLKILDDIIYDEENPSDPEDRFARFGCNYAPIPSTEENLLKIGFEVDYDSSMIRVLSLSTPNRYWRFHFDKRNPVNTHLQIKGFDIDLKLVQYIHQIQNIYFDIEGSKLPFK